jgi:hypothetical protein
LHFCEKVGTVPAKEICGLKKFTVNSGSYCDRRIHNNLKVGKDENFIHATVVLHEKVSINVARVEHNLQFVEF